MRVSMRVSSLPQAVRSGRPAGCEGVPVGGGRSDRGESALRLNVDSFQKAK